MYLAVPSLFLPYRPRHTLKTALVEVQAIAPPNKRSWFLSDDDEVVESAFPLTPFVNVSHVYADGNLLVMTPVDPVFLLLPVLKSVAPVSRSNDAHLSARY